MPHLDLGSRSLYHERRGAGEPLLLIQGMAGHHALWGTEFLGALDSHFDVVSFDHRGIGESSDEPATEFSIADLADDAVASLDALGWADAHVLGISMGGMVAQEIALRHPDRVRRLVLGCTYSGGPDAALGATGPLRMLQAMGTGRIDTALRAAFTANFSPTFTADESHYEPFKSASLSVRVPVPIVMRQAKACFVHDTSARLPAVTTPTLVVHGTADEMIDYANSAHVVGLIPGATLHSFDGVGHLFWWEQPDATAELVRAHCLD
jgi:3-oxoadipate enol-lactonase